MKQSILLITLLVIISCRTDHRPSSAVEPTIGIDYHVHIKSPEMGVAMKKLCGTLIQCPGDSVANSNHSNVLPSLDSTVFQKALLISMGYMASMPELQLDSIEAQQLTRIENEFTIAEAAKSEKLNAFFSVNPLTDYAVEEAEYWMNNGGASGMKLHLANSDFDFFNDDHIQRLKAVLKIVDDSSMGILAHIRNRNPKYGPKDMEVFINEILGSTSNVTWVIAHAGGWGGYDQATDSVLTKMVEAIKTEQVDANRVFLDMAFVVLPEEVKKGLPYPPEVLAEQEAKFLEKFRSLGTANWVFGSDWSPDSNKLEPYVFLETLRNIGFEEAELNAVVNNRLPFIN